MNHEDQNIGSQSSQGRKILIGGTLVVAVLMMCGVMTAAGFAIGRASIASDVEPMTTIQTSLQEDSVAEETDDTDIASETDTAVSEAESEIVAEPTAPTEPPVATKESQPELPSAASRLEDVDDIDFDTFFEAWQLIEEGFDGELPSNEEILYSAIEGSIDELDDNYTRFIRPDVAARLREDAQGAVEGIGAFVQPTEEGFFEIVRPIPGQPAEIAGLLPGDLVIAVDGESVEDVSFDEVIMMVRGPQGTEVTLTIAREGELEPLEFTITRVRYEVPTVKYEMLENDIAYIKLAEFNRTAYDKTVAAFEELSAQDPQALIFDLRDNPGGFLDQSVDIADLFLSENVVLFERNRTGDINQTFNADDGDLGEKIPMVVLVNAGSASASEIVSGALQDHGRAILIGETTFGKGSVQHVLTLSDGSELRVTIARWYTPDNNSISEAGITPDIEVPMEFDAEEDIQLQRAIDYILNGE